MYKNKLNVPDTVVPKSSKKYLNTQKYIQLLVYSFKYQKTRKTTNKKSEKYGNKNQPLPLGGQNSTLHQRVKNLQSQPVYL